MQAPFSYNRLCPESATFSDSNSVVLRCAQRASGRQVASGAISAAVQSALERLPDPVDSSTREGGPRLLKP